MTATLTPPAAQSAATYQRAEYPAMFHEIPVGTHFTTPAVPKCEFRKSTDNRGECVNRPSKSQRFNDNAPIYPIGWERPEPAIEDDGDTEAVGAVESTETLPSPRGPGQRTVAAKGQSGQGAVLSKPQGVAAAANSDGI